MIDVVKLLLIEVECFSPNSEQEVEEFRIKFLGKKGEMNTLFAAFKEIPNENKKEFGQEVNTLKQNAQAKVDAFKGSFNAEKKNKEIILVISFIIPL